MSDVLPKEKQTAYQRWELASFGDNRPSQQVKEPAPPPAPVGPTREEIAELNRQLEEIRETARQHGYDDGLDAGRAAGHELGLAEGRKLAAEEASRLKQLTQSFSTDVGRANDVVADDLLVLALDIAKALLKTSLVVKPGLVLPIISEAIHYLPSLQQPAVLFLHPDDALLVKEYMAEELTGAGWRVTEDTRIERGGCRIETASNEIDALITSRWERIAASLGKDSSWLGS
jgi:flagellar assembly protein FliH